MPNLIGHIAVINCQENLPGSVVFAIGEYTLESGLYTALRVNLLRPLSWHRRTEMPKKGL